LQIFDLQIYELKEPIADEQSCIAFIS